MTDTPKYSILFLDLDGTVIPYGPNSTVSERVKKAISSVAQKMYVCVATGRPLSSALEVMNMIRLTGPCVICSGIQIYDPVQKAVIREYGFDVSLLPAIRGVASEFNIDLNIYDGFIDFPYQDSYNGKILSLYLPKIKPEIVSAVEQRLRSIEDIAVHKMPSWEKGFIGLDITDKMVSKLHGIHEVYQLLGLNKENAVAIGDSYNDYSLLMACNLKIAMGNAVDELKVVADFIAPGVEDDGVATVIEKFLL